VTGELPREAMQVDHVRPLRAIIFLILATLLTLSVAASPASATRLSEKRAKAREIQAKLEKVYPQVDMAVERYNQAMERLATVNQKIKQNEHQLKVAKFNLEAANAQLETRAVSMYKSRGLGIIDVVFSTSSFDELVTQLDMMQRLGESDVSIVKQVAAYKRDIEERHLQLEADRKTATRLVEQAKQQNQKIQELQARLERMQAGVRAQIKQLQAAAARAARLAAERAQAQATAQAAAASSSSANGAYSQPAPVDPGGPGHPEIVAIARRELGDPYVFAAAGPNAFDCSGLTMYCYAQIGIGLIHGATYQYRASTPVPLSALLPGDLVFFGSPSYCYHVGIYAGGGQMIAAPHTGAVVSYGSISGAFSGGRF
jgi:peptidoglycan DL-endopeptidase CwlO